MEANEVQSNKSRDESIKERKETEKRVAVSLAAAMEATKDRPEREIKGQGDAEAPAKMEGELENMEWMHIYKRDWLKQGEAYLAYYKAMHNL